MNAIHLSIVEAPVPLDKALRGLFDELGISHDVEINLTRAINGKPKLDISSHPAIGFSLSHARIAGGEISAMALVECRDVGIDIEAWPAQKAEASFLETVASPEDGKALSILAAGGRDAGVALWVIKEAALKCTGEVMTDPRNLDVSKTHKGLFAVTTSMCARAPHPDIDVRLFILESEHALNQTLLVGIALAKGAHMTNRELRKIQFQNSIWSLSELLD